MSKCVIKSWFADHEEGSKFYQVYSVELPNGSFLITHWGAKASFGSYCPKEMGSSKMKKLSKGTSEWDAKGVRSGKGKRGYRFREPVETSYLLDAGLRDTIYRTFDIVHAEQILQMVDEWHVPITSAVADDEGFVWVADPKPMPEIEIIRGSEWGSW